MLDKEKTKKMTEQTKDSFSTATEQLLTSEIISEVPGVDSEAYVPEVVVNSDQVAIALARREAGRHLYELVSAQAVHDADAARAAQSKVS